MTQKELDENLAQGQLLILREWVSRGAMPFAGLGTGSIIGEIALIDESERPTTILSETATVGYLSRDALVQLVELMSDFHMGFCVHPVQQCWQGLAGSIVRASKNSLKFVVTVN